MKGRPIAIAVLVLLALTITFRAALDRVRKENQVWAIRVVDGRIDAYRQSDYYLTVNQGDSDARTLRVAQMLGLLSPLTYPQAPDDVRRKLRAELASADEESLPPEGKRLLAIARARLAWWSGSRSRPFCVVINGSAVTEADIETFLRVFPLYRYEPEDRPVPSPLLIEGYERYEFDDYRSPEVQTGKIRE